MDISGRENSCTITWNPSGLTLDDLARFTSLLFELHNEVAAPYVTDELYQQGSNAVPPRSPLVVSVSMGSPFITQLLAGEGGVLSLGMLGFILNNPEKLGGFLPAIRESWYKGNRKALKAKIKSVEDRARVDARGIPIRKFEREYSRTRERPRRDRRRDDRPRRSR